jgi:hypothetical protein
VKHVPISIRGRSGAGLPLTLLSALRIPAATSRRYKSCQSLVTGQWRECGLHPDYLYAPGAQPADVRVTGGDTVLQILDVDDTVLGAVDDVPGSLEARATWSPAGIFGVAYGAYYSTWALPFGVQVSGAHKASELEAFVIPEGVVVANFFDDTARSRDCTYFLHPDGTQLVCTLRPGYSASDPIVLSGMIFPSNTWSDGQAYADGRICFNAKDAQGQPITPCLLAVSPKAAEEACAIDAQGAAEKCDGAEGPPLASHLLSRCSVVSSPACLVDD